MFLYPVPALLACGKALYIFYFAGRKVRKHFMQFSTVKEKVIQGGQKLKTLPKTFMALPKKKKIIILAIAILIILALILRAVFASGSATKEIRTAKVDRGDISVVISGTGTIEVGVCLRNGIRSNEIIFPITERAVQKQLRIVCDYLVYEGIGTHSFRKWYATEIYKNNGYDIALVQRLLQHSSAAVTQRYIGIEPQRIEAAIEGHAQLL